MYESKHIKGSKERCLLGQNRGTKTNKSERRMTASILKQDPFMCYSRTLAVILVSFFLLFVYKSVL